MLKKRPSMSEILWIPNGWFSFFISTIFSFTCAGTFGLPWHLPLRFIRADSPNFLYFSSQVSNV